MEVKMKILNIFKGTLLLLALLVTAMFTFTAIYFNINKVTGVNVSKYIQIAVDKPAKVEEIAASYSDPAAKHKFINETMRVNSINSNGYISNRTIIVPVFE